MGHQCFPCLRRSIKYCIVWFIFYAPTRAVEHMISLRPNEKILIVLHRHWIVVVAKIATIVFLFLFSLMVIPVLISMDFFTGALIGPTLFFFVIYLMLIILMIFIIWINYYLDSWIITTDRVIDIEQKSLFYREVSEFMLDRVEDITVEVPGMIATFFRYGNIRIQTAGEKPFTIRDIAHIYEAKRIILENTRRRGTTTTSV